jgi:exodeoxyribonuclease V alpha subunit
VRSQNPRGFGGAIFTGVPIDAHGAVLSASSYLVVRASAGALGSTRVERGQWWSVSGMLAERRVVVEGITLIEQQVEADAAELARPSGEHIVRFIAENPEFDGLGMVKARRLWERFGEGLYDLLDGGNSNALAVVLTADAAQRLVVAWALHGQSRSLQWLQAQGFDLRIGRKVLEFFGDKAQDFIEEDPYRLLSFCGEWAVVDRMARERFGLRKEDERRLLGAVEEACYRALANGHTSMLSADLMERVKPLLGTPPEGVRWRDLLATALSEGLKNGSFVQTHHGLQPLGALVMERQVAAAIHSRLLPGPHLELIAEDAVEEVISDVYAHDGVELNPEQRNAIHLAARHAFVCITGGAGVGKTTVLKALYHLYDRAGVKVVQVALAGRAAKRMQEATGRPASTIASFLKDLGEGSLAGPTVLVIDEASMVDIISMSRICDALPSHVRLVLVGDPHQLMPVGPGLVLHCVQKLPSIPVAELKTVKRYGGDIAAVASAIRAGAWPAISADETAAVAFVPCEDRLIAEMVVELYALRPTGTQILAPTRNGPAGTKALNSLCQERFSKGQRTVTCWNDEFEVAEHCGLNVGDVVLCTRNLWDKGLQNGSLGRLVQVEDAPRAPSAGKEAPSLATIIWDDDDAGKPLTSDMLDDIELGYAVTVHKAQGSQWPRIIIPVTDSKFLDRTLLYTAITRSQQQVILVGNADAARRAVLAPPRAQERNVGLDLVLARLISESVDVDGGREIAAIATHI